MITKYKTTTFYHNRIEEVEVIRETKHCVFLPVKKITGYGQNHRFTKGEKKAAKVTEYECYHDSWDAAHEHLMKCAQLELDSARVRLQKAQSYFGNIKGMKKPANTSPQ